MNVALQFFTCNIAAGFTLLVHVYVTIAILYCNTFSYSAGVATSELVLEKVPSQTAPQPEQSRKLTPTKKRGR